MNNLISLIVPVYNVAEYLPECIESIINQTYKNLEIILVDDGSTDNSRQIFDEYAKKDSRIVVIHQKNKGLVGARKSGANIAKGEFIGYVDGDDWIEPQMYEHLLEKILETDADFVDCGWIKDNNTDLHYPPVCQLVTQNINSDIKRKSIIKEFLMCKWVENPEMTQSMCTKLIKKDLLLKAQEYLSDELINGEDIVCVLYLIQFTNKICFIDKYYYHYRTRNNSLSLTNSMNTLLPRFIIKLREIYKFLDIFNYEDSFKKIANYFVFHFILRSSNLGQSQEDKKFDLFLYPKEKLLTNKKVILYGAGIVGKNYYKHYQNATNDFEIVAWADKNYKNLKDYLMPIEAPENIKNYDYDYVLVCIKNENIFNEIKNELINLSVPEQKIIYNEREDALAWLLN